MIATHIIAPPGYTVIVLSTSDGKFWIEADKHEGNKCLSIDCSLYPSEEMAISQWNAVFSKAPRGYA